MTDNLTRNLRRSVCFLALLLLAPLFAAAATPPPDRWIGTWGAAPVAAGENDPKFGGADTTFREIVHVSLGGALVQVSLSNEFGADPLLIGAAHVALASGKDGGISLFSANALTFAGRPFVTIPPGGIVVSDPVAMKLPAFADVAVSLFIPAQTIQRATLHSFADQTNFAAPGNVVSSAKLAGATPVYSWPFLREIDVQSSATDAGAVVCLGDSITDGAHSTRDANARWPDVLARRLAEHKGTRDLGVLNEGIGGNRILHNGYGPNALARFDHDVLAQAGVKYLILLEGINDIGAATGPGAASGPQDVVTADDLIAGLGEMAARAHTHGIQVFGATLTPFMGAGYASPAGEAMREAVNTWVRTSHQLDGFIDFDKATRDPSNPAVFNASADSGDHLHPKDAGYKSMGDVIDLKLFETKK